MSQDKIDFNLLTGAVFSDDEKYRYALWRIWHREKKPLLFIGLNPSTANQSTNDPTITRLVARAYEEGFGGLLVGNLYALVSSCPDVLLRNDESIGLETDKFLTQMVGMANRVLCGWGSFPAVKSRVANVLSLIPSPFCLCVNYDGQPKHPLYVAYRVKMTEYNGYKC